MDDRAGPADIQRIKTAETEHEVLDLISQRWSPRAFADRPVEPDKLRSILEAARWAPSSYNEQPWRFILARRQDAAEFDRLLQCLNEKNQRWAQNAPALMLTVARRRFSHNDRENRHAWHDVGLAMGNLLAQATALGLRVHQMAGILPEVARDTYEIPDAFEPVAGVAIGYAGDPEALPEKLQKRERTKRTRRALKETVFEGGWKDPAPLVAEAS